MNIMQSSINYADFYGEEVRIHRTLPEHSTNRRHLNCCNENAKVEHDDTACQKCSRQQTHVIINLGHIQSFEKRSLQERLRRRCIGIVFNKLVPISELQDISTT